ncbi:MAG: Na(+)-translocating NADH-quinone reductase subunit C [Desulfobacterales bacterium]|nr:Na(+)-translocating NADH-quinone reductase subunit C [Deltaproteobacteria bacterium]MBT8360222.1 Na(+)-translocating NADH-quinone reductase subunit C [Deltaproteobacteria bacterium]NNK97332.1 Na(+)-translocating NADH-quinone reductase subunit C [Desulfobacterales bacterium]
MADEHPLKPFYSVLVLAFGCSALVATAAVGLAPLQEANRSIDKKKNILNAAGIYQKDKPVEDQFSAIETRIIELASGEFVANEESAAKGTAQIPPAVAMDASRELKREEDIAGIRALEKYSYVYLVKNNDQIDQVVLPVRGKGLWSTMYAYVALDSDMTTLRGVSFYEHGETPGLGGEVENPRWQSGWQNKKVYSPDGEVEFSIVRSSSESSPEEAAYQVDGLSGATLTSQGVETLMQFWFGEHGFRPFFNQIKKQGGFNG